MAKKSKNNEDTISGKQWKEGEIIGTFNLNRITQYQTPLMQEWLDVPLLELNIHEQYSFDKKLARAQKHISGWNEEDLKMKFISPILELGSLLDDDIAIGYFDKTISATVEGVKLTVKSDFMLAEGILDVFKTPYFHFQEYKPSKNPTGDSMAQLLEAFLIAQEKNKNGKPLYGLDIMGYNWRFVTMEGKDYCMSEPFNAIDRADLLKIIAVLRKFKHILATKLLN
ncbi:MAG: hypothetical protein RLZZ292_2511 [Bacteroidota bacterium]|jgi:hypothetical protein